MANLPVSRFVELAVWKRILFYIVLLGVVGLLIWFPSWFME